MNQYGIIAIALLGIALVGALILLRGKKNASARAAALPKEKNAAGDEKPAAPAVAPDAFDDLFSDDDAETANPYSDMNAENSQTGYGAAPEADEVTSNPYGSEPNSVLPKQDYAAPFDDEEDEVTSNPYGSEPKSVVPKQSYAAPFDDEEDEVTSNPYGSEPNSAFPKQVYAAPFNDEEDEVTSNPYGSEPNSVLPKQVYAAPFDDEEDEVTSNPYGSEPRSVVPLMQDYAAPFDDEEDEATSDPYAEKSPPVVRLRKPFAQPMDDEETAAPYSMPMSGAGAGRTAYQRPVYDSEATVDPYGRQGYDSEATIDPYGRSYDSEATIDPYGRQGYDSEATIDPYGRSYDSEATIDPYGRQGYDSEATVDAYGRSYDSEATTDPFGRVASGGMADPYQAMMEEEEDLFMDEEGTINPYSTDWMPKLTIGFALAAPDGESRKEITFSGSMWIGNGHKCELKLDLPQTPVYCAELTYGGGNLYVRNISPNQESVSLDDEPLGSELVPLRKGGCIAMGGARITIEYIS